ncbi:MAG: BatA domain-containing protein [Planctomycetota bacterium]
MFLYPALVAGFAFVAVPLLVHLINLLRHQKRRWAAMDFLMASYRKQRKWIRMRQLLLLLSRLAVAALLIALLAGWTGSGPVAALIGGATTHHVVVLDDSYSMGSRRGGATSYQRALEAIENLARRLASDDGLHQLTLIRSSQAALSMQGDDGAADRAADLVMESMDAEASPLARVMATSVSTSGDSMASAIELASELIEGSQADQTNLYLISDFRKNPWGAPEDINAAVQSVPADTSIRLVDCAEGSGDNASNLAITDLSPQPDVWVAGVPVTFRVAVANRGSTPASDVQINAQVVQYDEAIDAVAVDRPSSGDVKKLPSIVLPSIPPGQTVTKTFQVFVPAAGKHAVEVSLADDSLLIDNRRVALLPLTDAERVLIIDGTAEREGAYFLAAVMDPGSQVRIGAIPDIQPLSFLRGIDANRLAEYRAVYLIDVPTIGENAADALSRYVAKGGGLAWFLGENVDFSNYNQRLVGRRGEGIAGVPKTFSLLPAALSKIASLPPRGESTGGDLTMTLTRSPLTDPLRSVGDAALSLIRLSKTWTLQPNENPESDSNYATILQRRDGQPLVTTQDVGNGRVITVLTGLDGRWTNWPGDPTFVVFTLQANATLWSGAAPQTSRTVRELLAAPVPRDAYVEQLSYYRPELETSRLPINLQDFAKVADISLSPSTRSDVDSPKSDYPNSDSANAGNPNNDSAGIDPLEQWIEGRPFADDLMTPGLGEWSWLDDTGRTIVQPVATVIRVDDSDMARVPAAAVLQSLAPREATFVSSTAWSEQNNRAGSSKLTLILLALLGTFLALEQMLAAWASYHIHGEAGRKKRPAATGATAVLGSGGARA